MKGRMDLNDRFDSKETVFVKKLLQRELERKVRKKLVDFLFKKYVTKDEEEFSKKLYLSLDEIKEMKNSGMAFGSHCYSHEWLDILEENELNFEFERGIEFLKTINCKNKIMCFPYGCYDENILEKMEKFKFDAAFNTEIGNNILDEKIKFKLKRFDCNDFKKCY